MTAQLLDIDPDEYHKRPELSSTLAKTLNAKSPLHAKLERGKPPTKAMDRGKIIHRLLLGKGSAFEVCHFGDWKTKAAQAARDNARARGLVPVLACDFEEYNVAAEAIRVQLAERGIELDGDSELAMTWEEPSQHGPVACRAMFDHIWIDRGLILDFKVTECAAPSSVERTAENLGYAIQAAAYTRALAALRPSLAGRVGFLFAFVEPDEPHAINLSTPDGSFLELGERRWRRAVETWAECVATDTWPSYGASVNTIFPPGWALAREIP
jgi:hypothetical protein